MKISVFYLKFISVIFFKGSSLYQRQRSCHMEFTHFSMAKTYTVNAKLYTCLSLKYFTLYLFSLLPREIFLFKLVLFLPSFLFYFPFLFWIAYTNCVVLALKRLLQWKFESLILVQKFTAFKDFTSQIFLLNFTDNSP